ncbi:MAG TPA: M24 family metallopeptidase C-terminal domain-containing protein, partial [Caulobacteraceae bacterium]|nr:M24 family metallopeptidase C-terminal domain-containing protein [Caulobacteraceae bacterium]
TGAYGIRIENLQVTMPAAQIAGGERDMLGFETLTLAPIDRHAIARELLTDEEREQLNAYHGRVLWTVGPLVGPDVRAWLEGACAAI